MLLFEGSRQLIQLENISLGRNESFYGFQPEQIDHTHWDYFSDESRMDGGYAIDIAWVNVLGYSSYLDIAESWPDIINSDI